jgi:hypothetical protein
MAGMLSRGLGKKKDEELPDPSPVLLAPKWALILKKLEELNMNLARI